MRPGFCTWPGLPSTVSENFLSYQNLALENSKNSDYEFLPLRRSCTRNIRILSQTRIVYLKWITSLARVMYLKTMWMLSLTKMWIYTWKQYEFWLWILSLDPYGGCIKNHENSRPDPDCILEKNSHPGPGYDTWTPWEFWPWPGLRYLKTMRIPPLDIAYGTWKPWEFPPWPGLWYLKTMIMSDLARVTVAEHEENSPPDPRVTVPEHHENPPLKLVIVPENHENSAVVGKSRPST